jgi:hypothetical protein
MCCVDDEDLTIPTPDLTEDDYEADTECGICGHPDKENV